MFEGPSRIDGKPIVVIATLGSKNTKTGNMIQTWILRSDESPIDIVSSGSDVSICGNCPLRGFYLDGKWVARSCYVRFEIAPNSVYKAYKRGSYLSSSGPSFESKLEGRNLRIGSYGDPCAVPLKVWEKLKYFCSGRVHTGYTHQWDKPENQEYKKFLMASTHNGTQSAKAHELGWRTFETTKDELSNDSTIVCPSVTKGITCEQCGSCNGSNNKKNISIPAHGPKHKVETLNRISLLVV